MNSISTSEPSKSDRAARMIRAGIHLVVLVTGVGMSATTCATELPLEKTIKSASTSIFAKSGAPGMVIVIMRGDTLIIQGYGETQKGNGQPPGPHSLIRLGSISKVLATDLMVKLADAGKLRLSDSLQKYAPPGYKVPHPIGEPPITLLNLATHTSGLPRSVDGKVPEQAPPFTWPDKTTRWNWLSRQAPISPAGQAALYSNAAFDFLADAIAIAGKKPYDQLLRKIITVPLGMRDTTATPTETQCERLMIDASIDPAEACADTRATAGSGGMYSTAADMGIWMQYLLGIKQEESASQRAVAQAIYVQRQALVSVSGLDLAGPASGLGLGWVLLAPTNNSPAILQKTGGGGGFMSYMALVPGRRIGVFVAVTKVDLDMFAALTRDVNNLAALLDF